MTTDIPAGLHYTATHEWVADSGAGRVRVGITNYAQDALGDIVYVSLPEVGATVAAGTPCGELESTKSVSDLDCPVDGTVVAQNPALTDAPETVNGDPYGEGWLIEVELADPAQLDGLLDADGYGATLH